MSRNLLLAVPFLLAISCSGVFAGEKFSARMSTVLAATSAESPVCAWVVFTDKGESRNKAGASDLVSPAALQRRKNVLPEGSLTDESDLPLDPSYVASVGALVTSVRQQSKWLNRMSVLATASQLTAVAQLACVKEIDLVARFAADRSMESASATIESARSLQRTTDSLEYGASRTQLAQIGVPALHQAGNAAQGVIVGVFDNGFRLLTHTAFDSLRTRILATYDFVDHKQSVVPNNTSASFGGHGVNTLSTIGGYAPGYLIGPAYGASYILARTENDSSETPIEEDNWIAAIEWAESLGVQVTSTSLGYLSFDSGYTSLTWADMDGRTAPMSIAATMAARKGVVVVNSAGNEGRNSTHNTLIAPADADSILTAGAVDSSGTIASFSSNGPTTDSPARIKPDVCAMGVRVAVASATVASAFGTASGTSFSCPLVAGVAALLVHDNPTATPMQIINALRNTAGNASSPNSIYGWGVINASSADANLANDTSSAAASCAFSMEQNYPNPFNTTTVISGQWTADSWVKLVVYDLLGREVAALAEGQYPAGTHSFTFNARNLASGMYFYRMTVGSSTRTRKMILIH